MLYHVAIALKNQEDIQCIRTIVETMSFSFEHALVALEELSVSEHLKSGRVDLLILDLADRAIEQFALKLRRQHPQLWMILLDRGRTDPLAFCQDRRSILLQTPVSTMRTIHALHSAAAGMTLDGARQGSRCAQPE